MAASSRDNIWQHCLVHYAGSDVGLRRFNNQDSLAVDLAPTLEAFRARGHLFLVADGMGAHAAGELASRVAAETIPLAYRKLRDLSPPDALREAVEEANRQIHLRGKSSEDFRGMGTTVSALCLLPEGAYAAQVGDSRTYLCRKDCIQQLSYDHSLVWELRSLGNLPANANLDYVPKNIITRSLGPNPTVEVDLEGPFAIEAGDVFLLCSDGLSGQVTDTELGQVLSCLPPSEAGPALIDLANLRGGPDNITLIIVKVLSPQCEAPNGAPTDSTRGTRSSQRGDTDGSVKPSGWRSLIPFFTGLLGVFFTALGFALRFIIQANRKSPLDLVLFIFGLLLVGTSCLLDWIGKRGKSGPIHGSRYGPRLGKGPYTSASTAPQPEFSEKLKNILRELEAAARHEQWQMPWDRLQAFQQRAEQATASRDYATAIAEQCRAISLVMNVARSQGNRKPTPPTNFYQDFDQGRAT